MQFSGPAPVNLFPPTETGKGEGREQEGHEQRLTLHIFVLVERIRLRARGMRQQ